MAASRSRGRSRWVGLRSCARAHRDGRDRGGSHPGGGHGFVASQGPNVKRRTAPTHGVDARRLVPRSGAGFDRWGAGCSDGDRGWRWPALPPSSSRSLAIGLGRPAVAPEPSPRPGTASRGAGRRSGRLLRDRGRRRSRPDRAPTGRSQPAATGRRADERRRRADVVGRSRRDGRRRRRWPAAPAGGSTRVSIADGSDSGRSRSPASTWARPSGRRTDTGSRLIARPADDRARPRRSSSTSATATGSGRSCPTTPSSRASTATTPSSSASGCRRSRASAGGSSGSIPRRTRSIAAPRLPEVGPASNGPRTSTRATGSASIASRGPERPGHRHPGLAARRRAVPDPRGRCRRPTTSRSTRPATASSSTSTTTCG